MSIDILGTNYAEFGDTAAEWNSYIDKDGTQGGPSGTNMSPTHGASSSPLENASLNAKNDHASHRVPPQSNNADNKRNSTQVPFTHAQ